MIYESVGWDGLWEMSIASMPRRNGCPISSSGAMLVIVSGYERSRPGDYIVLAFFAKWRRNPFRHKCENNVFGQVILLCCHQGKS